MSDSSFSAELFSGTNQPPFQPQAGQGHPQNLSLWERLISSSASWTMAGRGAKMCYWQCTEGSRERWGVTPQTYFCIKNCVSLSAFNYSGAALPPGTGKSDPRSQKVVEEKTPCPSHQKAAHGCLGVYRGNGRHPFWQPGHTLFMEEEIKQKTNLTVSGLNTQVCSLYACVIPILIGSTCEKGEKVHRG